jgi:transposase
MEKKLYLEKKYKTLLPHLNERMKRLVCAADAISIGFGGVSIVSKSSGISRVTITKGKKEIHEKPLPENRIRKKGAGRKTVYISIPEIEKKLEALVDPVTRGDPMSPLRWTCKSTRELAEALFKQGNKTSHRTVGKLLLNMGYSLQSNKKTKEGKDHPSRDKQFNYINEITKDFLENNYPVISVDTKKKELIGNYKNAGKEWQPKGTPIEVNGHDFPDKELGKAIPYGIYDVGENTGWVNIGIDHDTAFFAVESIRKWWNYMGRKQYNITDKLLILADAGGSNSYRSRLWKKALQEFANETGLAITVCHFPPGTSKWNKIEHRLFSHITMNWRGKPLTSHEVIVNLIGNTKTKTGLKVKAELDNNDYPTQQKVSDEEMKKINLKPHDFQEKWNYTIFKQ